MITAVKKIYILFLFAVSALFFFAGGVYADVPVKTAGGEKGAAAKNEFLSADVFVSGEGGYNTYRIPSIVVTKIGTVLAFCEGRKSGRGDSGDIDTVLKRSVDGGGTWSDLQVVFDDAGNTCGNPCTVIDQYTGTVWLLSTWNSGLDTETAITKSTGKDTRRVYACFSKDDGVTWSNPKEITADVKPDKWTWYATGPGSGIQLRIGEKKGRLIVPCDHKAGNDKLEYHSHVIYSDDHGQSWHIGGSVADGTNECHVIERTDGTLLLNMRRSRGVSEMYKLISTSSDAGATWSKYSPDKTLVAPRCQSSMIRYTLSNSGKKPIVLHCNPASKNIRKMMTLRVSCDDAKSWMYSKVLHKGPSAYSSMAVMPDGRIVSLLETGKNHPYEKITFMRFSIEWLTDGKEKTIVPKPPITKYSLLTQDLVDKTVDAVSFDAAAESEKTAGHPAGYEPNSIDNTAVITTNAFSVDGDSLCVSAEIKKGGSLRIVIADEKGNTLASSRPVNETAKEVMVTWQEGWNFASTKGQKIRLKFVFEKAKLYEFQIK
ncbi:MAG: exo-alpha-sialidase [Planctomycetes bacterium]|nr:exo-alpha-sialidase [Planctomycetota bacterium]